MYATTRFGNVPLLKALFEQLVLPLHAASGVSSVAMAGSMS